MSAFVTAPHPADNATHLSAMLTPAWHYREREGERQNVRSEVARRGVRSVSDGKGSGGSGLNGGGVEAHLSAQVLDIWRIQTGASALWRTCIVSATFCNQFLQRYYCILANGEQQRRKDREAMPLTGQARTKYILVAFPKESVCKLLQGQFCIMDFKLSLGLEGHHWI
jgi:hypothetical protein